tara:strand:+ start:345 stop:1049 length:705 start_codon:yes stop_codon:yes gene_type:complete
MVLQMRLAVCISGVNDKNSSIVNQLKNKLPEGTYYYHTFSNKTNLVDKDYHENLYTMHYPKWHYHPMDVKNICKHGKFTKYVNDRSTWDQFYDGIVPIIQHCDLLRKIPKDFDLIIRVDWNTQIDSQVNLHHWLRKAHEKGPVGFMTRSNRGPKFGSGKIEELAKDNNATSDDWYHYLPKALIIHHRKHFDTKLVSSLVNNAELLPSEWGWYQVLSAPYNVIHTSVHGFAQEIK